MLIKLIKHDLIATKHEFLGIYLGYILLSVIAPFLILNGPEWLQVLSVFAVGGVLVAIIVITFLAIIRLFQKRLYSNEGYLTWTLPVSNRLNLISKIIVALIWNIASFVIVWVGVAIAGSIMLMQLNAFSQFFEVVQLLIVDSGFLSKIVQLFVLFTPQTIVSSLYSVIFLLFVITLVNTSFIKKNRLAIGIVLYFGLSLAINALTTSLIMVPLLEPITVNPDMYFGTNFMAVAAAILRDFDYTINYGAVYATIALETAYIVLMSIGILYFVEKKMEIE
ncbi:MAG: hypothetical protein LRY24_02090 [Erysipelotrichaceae bacterium]|nr:hypothetical protein [Erysipelotrichaceae bacterium]MCD8574341.1 hypothetical protein [Erysipelotrichaceae bacterium]